MTDSKEMESNSNSNLPVEVDDVDDADDFVQIFLLDIEIIKATNLIKADTFGKSDPFCKVTALGKSYTTKTIMKTLNPTWNEKTQMCFFNDPKQLKFEIFDWDKSSQDDSIGDATLSLDGFYDPKHAGVTQELHLENVKKGSVFIKVQARKLIPVELERRVDRLQDEVEAQKQSITTKNDRISNLNTANETLTNENTQLTTTNEQLTNEKSQLEQQLAQLTTNEMGLQTEIDRLAGVTQGLESQLNEAEGERDGVANELGNVRGEIAAADNETNDLNQTLDDLRRQLEDKRTAKAAAKARAIEDARAAKLEADRQRQAEEQARLEAEQLKKKNQKSKGGAVSDSTPLMEEPEVQIVSRESKTSDASHTNEAATQKESGGCNCCTVL